MTTTESTVRDKPNYYVTEHFMYSDFICPCCDTVKLVPGFYHHVTLLEQLRMKAGFPIYVTSGYRCKAHNAKIGGAARSWHLLFASDIKPEDSDQEKLRILYDGALELGFTGIGRYNTFIHLDLRPDAVRWRV